MPRQTSTHACGIVITKDPVDTYVPLYVRDGQISTTIHHDNFGGIRDY